ncbi:acetate CoA-transferase [Streptomyces sp. HNM0575]|nr:acetate CoA-transferase [Streptomyces sp. HNM0575]
MHVHFSATPSRPNAVLNAVARAFRDTRSLTVSVAAVHGNAHALGIARAARKVITGFLGETCPTPRPSPLYRDLLHGEPFEAEMWSLLTLQQRLHAAATGQRAVLTSSLAGTCLAEGKEDSLRHTTDPFTGEEGVLMRPLRPDVTVVHGVCADRRGNVVLCRPHGEGPWPAYAARLGVLASVECIVDDEVVDAMPDQVVVPGQRVLGLCEAPFGCHPQSLRTQGLAGVPGYLDDYAFLSHTAEACSDDETARRWFTDWIAPSHDDYLSGLGEKRLRALTGPPPTAPPPVRDGPEPSRKESLMILGARTIANLVRGGDYDTLLAGIGASHVAAWLAAGRLRSEGRTVRLVSELGFYGIRPHTGDVYLFSQLHGAEQLSSIADILGGMVAANPRCLGVLAAAETDSSGNVNTSVLPDGTWLTGSGGAHDIANAADCVVLAASGRRRYVPKVAAVTSPGRRVKAVVSDFGVFARRSEGFALASHFGAVDPDRLVASRTSWDVPADGAVVEEPVTAAELDALRRLDPYGHHR